jgi:hypothetical protein
VKKKEILSEGTRRSGNDGETEKAQQEQKQKRGRSKFVYRTRYPDLKESRTEEQDDDRRTEKKKKKRRDGAN